MKFLRDILFALTSIGTIFAHLRLPSPILQLPIKPPIAPPVAEISPLLLSPPQPAPCLTPFPEPIIPPPLVSVQSPLPEPTLPSPPVPPQLPPPVPLPPLAAPISPSSSPSLPPTCSLPLIRGPCEERLIKFGYSFASRKCSSFVYSGCQGNANNFATLEECNKACS
uniref:BPTI/Kunitz inhibitor domain-containing protein n=1 Tax=Haemonchus contortus TaxID=6289 RepID=A0A7I4YIL0_HAECO